MQECEEYQNLESMHYNEANDTVVIKIMGKTSEAWLLVKDMSGEEIIKFVTNYVKELMRAMKG